MAFIRYSARAGQASSRQSGCSQLALFPSARVSARDRPSGCEPARACIEYFKSGREVVPGLFPFGAQARSLEDPPVTHERHDDVVVMDAQVVDARLGDLHGLAPESSNDAAWHLEP